MAHALRPTAGSGGDHGPRAGGAGRIAVLFEPGRGGEAALREAALFADLTGSELTVVVPAPQAPALRCCGPSPDAFNCAVRDEAASELRQAMGLLGAAAERAVFTLLIEGRDPPLHAWVIQRRFDAMLLPPRRSLRRSSHHPALRRLRRVLGTRVRVVKPPKRGRAA